VPGSIKSLLLPGETSTSLNASNLKINDNTRAGKISNNVSREGIAEQRFEEVGGSLA